MAAAALAAALLVGAAAAPTALLPAPGPGPVPEDALQYLELAGGAVAVADLGGAEPWLAELHRRAAAPVLLWRGSALPRRGSAPRWMERAPAYLLAARGPQRLLSFIETDTAGARSYPGRVELSSAAHAVLALGSAPARTSDRQVQHLADRLLTALWERHEQFRGLLLIVRPAAGGGQRWDRRYLDPFRAGLRSGRKPVRGHAVLRPPAGASGPQLAALLGLRARDLNFGPMRVFWWQGEVSQAFSQEMVFGQRRLIIGCSMKAMIALGELMRFWIAPPDGPDRTTWGKIIYQTRAVGIQRNLGLQYADATTHFCLYSPHDEGFMEYLEASAVMLDDAIVVRRAPLLPGWTLPLRVFRPGVWALWAAAVLAYALAWHVQLRQPPAASLAAALRALSSCGGSPQDRVLAGPQRLQLASALLASAVVVVSTYQGQLYQLTVEPEREAEIDTLEQLAASNLTLLHPEKFDFKQFMPDAMAEFPQEQQQAVRRIMQQRRAVRPLYLDIVRVLREANYSTGFITDSATVDVMREMYAPDFQHMHRMRRLPPTKSIIMQFLPRNQPWRERMNELILRLRDTGLWQHWRETDNWFQKALFLSDPEFFGVDSAWALDSGPRVFALPDLQHGFYLLAAGLLLALPVFLAELALGRLRRPRPGRA